MRFRVDVAAEKAEMPWDDVFGPARAVVYKVITEAGRGDLAAELHDKGWGGQRLRPLGVSCPAFRGAKRVAAKYTTSGDGSVWFGSPVGEIAAALLSGLVKQERIRWGAVGLTVRGIEPESATGCEGGEVRFTTRTPVLVKGENGKFLAPEDPSYVERLRHNLRHKADVLGLPSDVDAEVVDAGPMRLFKVSGAPRRGAVLSVRVAGDPRLLAALYDWGVGLHNNQGFGWIQ